MATTGPKLQISHIVGSSAIVGQGDRPELWALYSTDDMSRSTPNWNTSIADPSLDVRSFSISRGRESELVEIDSGTAEIHLDNRGRVYDPVQDVSIRPMNRWWLRSQFSGETQDLFKGYAESYDQTWPALVNDAVAVVHCVDEMKILARDNLPTTDPPRDSYEELVQFDAPSLYWRMNDSTPYAERQVVGKDLGTNASSISRIFPGALAGSLDGARSLASTQAFATTPTASGDPEDITDSAAATMELWFRFSAAPGSNTIFYECPQSNAGSPDTFRLTLTTTGAIQASARNALGTADTATSSALG